MIFSHKIYLHENEANYGILQDAIYRYSKSAVLYCIVAGNIVI